MIAKIVTLAVRSPLIVGVLALFLVGIGIFSYLELDIEAYPNPVAPMIEVIAQPQGMSAEEVERYVTIPLETQLAGMADLLRIKTVRCRERDARAVTVQQVKRADLRLCRGRGTVDDRSHQVVPRPC